MAKRKSTESRVMTPQDVREQVLMPLMEAAGLFARELADWEAVIREGKVARGDLELTVQMALNGIGHVSDLCLQITKKKNAAVRGTYRWRKVKDSPDES